jgi:hypothetical protein
MNSGQFKFKPDKIKYLTNVSTLDSSHTKIINDINKKRNFLPKKEKKLEKLKCMLKELECNSKCVDNYVYLKSKIIEDIDMLTNEIDEICNYDDEINYFSKTYNILFNYYDQYDGINNNDYTPPLTPTKLEPLLSQTDIEPISDIKEGEENKDCDDLDILFKKTDKVDKLELLNQLSKQKRKEKKTTRKRIKNIETLIKDNNNIFSYLEKGKPDDSISISISNKQPKVYQDKATLFEEFRLVIDGVHTQKKISKFCINCNIDKILIYSEGTYTCTNCGEVESCIVESDITSYKDPMIEKPTFPYKRKNHFCEWINYLNCSLKYISFIVRAKYILISFL